MCPRNLAPNDPNLGASNLLLATVDVCNALAQVERCGLGVVDALNLNERCARVRDVLGALVRKVLAPVKSDMLVSYNFIRCLVSRDGNSLDDRVRARRT